MRKLIYTIIIFSLMIALAVLDSPSSAGSSNGGFKADPDKKADSSNKEVKKVKPTVDFKNLLLPALYKELKNDDETISTKSFKELNRRGIEAIPKLIDALNSEDERRIKAAKNVINKIIDVAFSDFEYSHAFEQLDDAEMKLLRDIEVELKIEILIEKLKSRSIAPGDSEKIKAAIKSFDNNISLPVLISYLNDNDQVKRQKSFDIIKSYDILSLGYLLDNLEPDKYKLKRDIISYLIRKPEIGLLNIWTSTRMNYKQHPIKAFMETVGIEAKKSGKHDLSKIEMENKNREIYSDLINNVKPDKNTKLKEGLDPNIYSYVKSLEDNRYYDNAYNFLASHLKESAIPELLYYIDSFPSETIDKNKLKAKDKVMEILSIIINNSKDKLVEYLSSDDQKTKDIALNALKVISEFSVLIINKGETIDVVKFDEYNIDQIYADQVDKYIFFQFMSDKKGIDFNKISSYLVPKLISKLESKDMNIVYKSKSILIDLFPGEWWKEICNKMPQYYNNILNELLEKALPKVIENIKKDDKNLDARQALKSLFELQGMAARQGMEPKYIIIFVLFVVVLFCTVTWFTLKRSSNKTYKAVEAESIIDIGKIKTTSISQNIIDIFKLIIGKISTETKQDIPYESPNENIFNGRGEHKEKSMEADKKKDESDIISGRTSELETSQAEKKKQIEESKNIRILINEISRINNNIMLRYDQINNEIYDLKGKIDEVKQNENRIYRELDELLKSKNVEYQQNISKEIKKWEERINNSIQEKFEITKSEISIVYNEINNMTSNISDNIKSKLLNGNYNYD